MAAGVVAEAGAGGGRAGTMVPVEIATERPRHRHRVDRKGIIEIEFVGGARVNLRGEVVPAVLRQVIELLR